MLSPMNIHGAVMLLLFEDIWTDTLTDMVRLRCATITFLSVNRPPAADADVCFIFIVYHRRNPSSNLPR